MLELGHGGIRDGVHSVLPLRHFTRVRLEGLEVVGPNSRQERYVALRRQVEGAGGGGGSRVWLMGEQATVHVKS